MVAVSTVFKHRAERLERDHRPRRRGWRDRVVGVVIVFEIVIGHDTPPSWKASSARVKYRAISSRPGAGARAFSTRHSETPDGRETINP